MVQTERLYWGLIYQFVLEPPVELQHAEQEYCDHCTLMHSMIEYNLTVRDKFAVGCKQEALGEIVVGHHQEEYFEKIEMDFYHAVDYATDNERAVIRQTLKNQELIEIKAIHK